MVVNIAKTGDLKDAKEYFQKSIELSNMELGYENLAQFDLLYGSANDARQIAQQGLVKHSDKPVLWFILAQAEYKLGDKQSALNDAQKSLQLEPNVNVYNFVNKINQEQK